MLIPKSSSTRSPKRSFAIFKLALDSMKGPTGGPSRLIATSTNRYLGTSLHGLPSAFVPDLSTNQPNRPESQNHKTKILNWPRRLGPPPAPPAPPTPSGPSRSPARSHTHSLVSHSSTPRACSSGGPSRAPPNRRSAATPKCKPRRFSQEQRKRSSRCWKPFAEKRRRRGGRVGALPPLLHLRCSRHTPKAPPRQA